MKNKIIYTGDEIEALWATLGYFGPMFIVTINKDKNSPFLIINALRSAIIFILFCIINIPVILVKYNIILLPGILNGLLIFIGFIFTTLLFIDYCYATYQSANGYYKKTFFIDKVFNKVINNYMISKFVKN